MADWKLSPGDWCHIDVVAADQKRAQKFYGDVFGWTFEDYGEEMGYVGVKTSDNGIESGIGGLAQATGKAPVAPNGVVPYILSPDIDATLAAIERAGGEIVIPRTDVFGYGEFAHFKDPDGNVVGLWRE
jgi:predicted enzyme related to lactoylglutathione lyase